jgi:hypothetical protein
MQQQQAPDWCWAAVAVSVHKFLDPAKANVWSQGTLANALLNRVDCTQSPTPDACDVPADLDAALSIVGNLGTPGFLQGQHLTFNSLENWINQQLPVCARIVWFAGGAHFIALDGYVVLTSGEQLVHVQDPWQGPSFQIYDTLVSDYPPGGAWTDTYTVQP